jgi:enamine deaminase RidA (YjgF/YER057c/UK114 family)
MSDAIERYGSDVKWEPIAGYSRAVRAGDFVFVSGTTASAAQAGAVGDSSIYLQAHEALRRIEQALIRAGGRMAQVVQTRMYLTDISRWDEAAKAHSEVFASSPPSTSLVEVSALIEPELLIEIEATAFAPR